MFKIKKIQKSLKRIQPIFEIVGIIAGLILIYFTHESLRIADQNIKDNKVLMKIVRMQYTQDSIKTILEINKLLPEWRIEVLDSNFVNFHSVDPEYTLNHVKIHHGLSDMVYSPPGKTDSVSLERISRYLLSQLSEDRIEEIKVGSRKNDMAFLRQYSIGVEYNYEYKNTRWHDYGVLYLRFSEYPDSSGRIKSQLFLVEASKYYSQRMYGNNARTEMKKKLSTIRQKAK